MLDVFITVDVEIWCNGRGDMSNIFTDTFQKYVYGPTKHGNFGLVYQLEVLKDHGLTGVFFVEPLFSMRFGHQPLTEIVGLLHENAQEVQLHLHTEWLTEALVPLFEGQRTYRQHLRNFSKEEQIKLIDTGLALLNKVGANKINAFRAGNFAFNSDTLHALHANGIPFDSSYNASYFGHDSGVMTGVSAVEPFECSGVYEYPMTVFHDGTGKLRHVQVTACSYAEIEGLLWQALEKQCGAFVLLCHNFELLNPAKNRPDNVVVKRFQKLCAFFEKNKDCFNVRGFEGLQPKLTNNQPAPLTSPLWKTGVRMIEQAYRQKYTW
jgi:hypothetical protein